MKNKPGFVRIIGGKWRSRRLQIPSVADLRPTPDRVRETLFNWLAPFLPGAYCLDAFAGSGALGIEALSRGAAHLVMVDQSAEIVRILEDELKTLGAEHILIYRATMPEQLRPADHLFDIVFLDPPYAANILLPTCFYLEEHGFLAPSAKIYLEARNVISDNDLPPNWRIIKCQKAGQVVYHLAQRVATHDK